MLEDVELGRDSVGATVSRACSSPRILGPKEKWCFSMEACELLPLRGPSGDSWKGIHHPRMCWGGLEVGAQISLHGVWRLACLAHWGQYSCPSMVHCLLVLCGGALLRSAIPSPSQFQAWLGWPIILSLDNSISSSPHLMECRLAATSHHLFLLPVAVPVGASESSAFCPGSSRGLVRNRGGPSRLDSTPLALHADLMQ